VEHVFIVSVGLVMIVCLCTARELALCIIVCQPVRCLRTSASFTMAHHHGGDAAPAPQQLAVLLLRASVVEAGKCQYIPTSQRQPYATFRTIQELLTAQCVAQQHPSQLVD
jgi:hypothetical protein